jgi:hypothetical protein
MGSGNAVYPSMTNILNVIPKHNALMAWAAKLERSYSLDKAAEFMRAEGTVPTVTQFDERFGRTKAHRGALEKAANIGTETHALIEAAMTRDPKFLKSFHAAPMPSRHAFNAWISWRESVKLDPIHVERIVWSHDLGIAGTADLIAKFLFGGATCVAVMDWKTSNNLYIEHRIQIAGYRQCAIEMGLVDESALGVILRLSKTKPRKNSTLFEPHVLMPSECDALADVISHLCEVWRFLTSNGVRL